MVNNCFKLLPGILLINAFTTVNLYLVLQVSSKVFWSSGGQLFLVHSEAVAL